MNRVSYLNSILNAVTVWQLLRCFVILISLLCTLDTYAAIVCTTSILVDDNCCNKCFCKNIKHKWNALLRIAKTIMNTGDFYKKYTQDNKYMPSNCIQIKCNDKPLHKRYNFQLFCKLPDGRTITVNEVCDSDTIKTVKKNLRQRRCSTVETAFELWKK